MAGTKAGRGWQPCRPLLCTAATLQKRSAEHLAHLHPASIANHGQGASSPVHATRVQLSRRMTRLAAEQRFLQTPSPTQTRTHSDTTTKQARACRHACCQHPFYHTADTQVAHIPSLTRIQLQQCSTETAPHESAVGVYSAAGSETLGLAAVLSLPARKPLRGGDALAAANKVAFTKGER
jgi:hypothetical protein